MSKTTCTPLSVSNSVFCVGGTQWVVLSATVTQNRVRNAHGGTGRRLQQARDGRRRHVGGIASRRSSVSPHFVVAETPPGTIAAEEVRVGMVAAGTVLRPQEVAIGALVQARDPGGCWYNARIIRKTRGRRKR